MLAALLHFGPCLHEQHARALAPAEISLAAKELGLSYWPQRSQEHRYPTFLF